MAVTGCGREADYPLTTRPLRHVDEGHKPSLGGPWSGPIILSLDGGGVRGYSSLVILQALVAEIAEQERAYSAESSEDSLLFQVSSTREKNQSRREDSFRLCHYFDYVCGTSSGGIIAIMLGQMRMTVRETMARSRRIWRGVVPGYHTKLLRAITRTMPKKENSTRIRTMLVEALEREFDQRTTGAVLEHTMEANEGRCKTIVFAMQSADEGLMRPYAIRSYPHTASSDPLIRNPDEDTTRMTCVDACQATSAAPQFFKKVAIHGFGGTFSDGSIWKTNPAGEVYREVKDLNVSSGAPIKGLLSVGYARENARPALTLSEDKTDTLLKARQAQEEFMYDRVICPQSRDGDDDPEIWFSDQARNASEFCKEDEIRSQIQRWAEFLVDTRNKRAKTIHWEAYAGLRRACPWCKSLLEPGTFDRHVKSEHLEYSPDSSATFKVSKSMEAPELWPTKVENHDWTPHTR